MSRQELLRSGDRIHHFDLLRGFFILLALYQHYTGYFNHWFVSYFKESGEALSLYYESFVPFIGVRLPMDQCSYIFSLIFIPWVSQIYLTLASFNLAKRTGLDFQQKLPAKLKVFALLFGFFLIENLIVAPDFGQGLSFYPIMAWMIILSMIGVLFRFGGIKMIWLLFALSFLRFPIPFTYADTLSHFLQSWIHPSFEYDARIEYYLSSGCLGFLMGHYYYHHNFGKRFHLPGIILGLVLIALWFAFGDAYTVTRLDIYETEHDLTLSFLGLLYLIGVQLVVMLGFLKLEEMGFVIKCKPVSWVGVHSLLVFCFHRIYFIFIAGPIWSFYTSVIMEREPYNSTIDIWMIMFFYLVGIAIIYKTKILELIARS